MFILRDFKLNDFVSIHSKQVVKAISVSAHPKKLSRLFFGELLSAAGHATKTISRAWPFLASVDSMSLVEKPAEGGPTEQSFSMNYYNIAVNAY